MLLLADPVSGLYVTGILEHAGKAKSFKEIHILTPEGISASVTKSSLKLIKSGKVLFSKDQRAQNSDQEVLVDDIMIMRHRRTKDWEIKIGNGIHFHVTNKHVSSRSF